MSFWAKPTTTKPIRRGLLFPVLVKSLMFPQEILAEIMGVLLYVTFHWNSWHPSWRSDEWIVGWFSYFHIMDSDVIGGSYYDLMELFLFFISKYNLNNFVCTIINREKRKKFYIGAKIKAAHVIAQISHYVTLKTIEEKLHRKETYLHK